MGVSVVYKMGDWFLTLESRECKVCLKKRTILNLCFVISLSFRYSICIFNV